MPPGGQVVFAGGQVRADGGGQTGSIKMDQHDQLLLKKLLAKSSRECGLDDIDHRELTRLIEQADAEDQLHGGVTLKQSDHGVVERHQPCPPSLSP